MNDLAKCLKNEQAQEFTDWLEKIETLNTLQDYKMLYCLQWEIELRVFQ